MCVFSFKCSILLLLSRSIGVKKKMDIISIKAYKLKLIQKDNVHRICESDTIYFLL